MFSRIWNAVKNVAKKVVDVVENAFVKTWNFAVDCVKAVVELINDYFFTIAARLLVGYLFGSPFGWICLVVCLWIRLLVSCFIPLAFGLGCVAYGMKYC